MKNIKRDFRTFTQGVNRSFSDVLVSFRVDSSVGNSKRPGRKMSKIYFTNKIFRDHMHEFATGKNDAI